VAITADFRGHQRGPQLAITGYFLVATDTGSSGPKHGAWEENRTPDLRITSALLYRLSYPGILRWERRSRPWRHDPINRSSAIVGAPVPKRNRSTSGPVRTITRWRQVHNEPLSRPSPTA
jgi:hypothetical protein